MVEDDPVRVVDDLGLVAELDRLAEPPFGDRSGVRVVQADQPSAAVGHHTGDPGPGLSDELAGALHGRAQLIDRAVQPALRLAGGLAQRPAGIAVDRVRVPRGGLGEVGQLAGDAPHGGLRFVSLLGAAQPQLARD